MAQTISPDFQKGMDDLKTHHAASLSALHETGSKLHKGLTEIGQFYNDHVASSFNSAMEAMKSMCGAKTPQEAANIQKEWLQDSMKTHMEKTSQLSQRTTALMKEVTQPMQDFTKKASESCFKAK